MADSRSPGGIKVPSAEAIEALNQNAQSVAQRSRIALTVAGQYQIGRDALRRDRQIRTPTARDMQLTPLRDVPPDEVPKPASLPTTALSNLLAQFRGQGLDEPVGGAGFGHSTSGGASGGTGDAGSTVFGSASTGVQTFTNDNPFEQVPHHESEWTTTAYRNTGFPPPYNPRTQEVRRGASGFWEIRTIT